MTSLGQKLAETQPEPLDPADLELEGDLELLLDPDEPAAPPTAVRIAHGRAARAGLPPRLTLAGIEAMYAALLAVHACPDFAAVSFFGSPAAKVLDVVDKALALAHGRKS